MPRPRFFKLDPEKRRRILEAAAVEFAANGYENASLNRAIEEAGLSKGAFYYYFDDKADLFATVAELAWDAMLPADRLEAGELDAESFWPRLEEAFLEVMDRVQQHSWLAGVGKLFYQSSAPAQLAQVVAETFERSRSWLASLVDRGREVGAVRRDLPAGLLLAMVTAAAEGADHWMVDHWEELAPEEVEGLGSRIFHTLRRLAEPAAAPGDEAGGPPSGRTS